MTVERYYFLADQLLANVSARRLLMKVQTRRRLLVLVASTAVGNIATVHTFE